jgi:signal transduction histidine kinase
MKTESVSPSVVVTLDNKNQVIMVSEYYAKISDEGLSLIINDAKNRPDGYRIIGNINIIYLKQTTSFGKKIAITDSSSLGETLKTTALTGSVICVAVLGVMFFVSLLLSSLAIKPVKEAWTRQKQFVADASHELKTPLTVILANNNILQGHAEETVAAQKQWLDSTQEEAGRMKKLIDQMLFLAKSDAEQTAPPMSKINLSELTERAALSFEPVAFEKNITIDTIIGENIIWVSNEELYERLLHILLDNAVKHAAENSTVVLALLKNGSRLFLSVNNKGDVINPDDLPHIFDRFYRADKARTSEASSSGYGLGLAIAKNILENIDGNIAVSSNEEDGTTFTVAFG